jgi:hypothetical protein
VPSETGCGLRHAAVPSCHTHRDSAQPARAAAPADGPHDRHHHRRGGGGRTYRCGHATGQPLPCRKVARAADDVVARLFWPWGRVLPAASASAAPLVAVPQPCSTPSSRSSHQRPVLCLRPGRYSGVDRLCRGHHLGAWTTQLAPPCSRSAARTSRRGGYSHPRSPPRGPWWSG